MNFRTAFAFALCFGIVFANQRRNDDEPKLWALLVAGSNEWFNYRHQADVYHAYHILHHHGIPNENIIVMHYDDIANNTQNPTPGIIINHPDGDDVYHNVPKDYTKRDVTPQNFINVLTGNKQAMKGIGSGRVIESGPKDHVFVNFVDHGATGILAFPDGELTVKELSDAIDKLHKEKRYNKLVFYVEACESGSMFKNVLPNNINVFATTASDYDESSYACYYDDKRGTYLGDWYSVNWMEDSDAEDIEKESLQKQFQITKNKTNTSHVQEYGDLTIAKLVVGEFQGKENPPRKFMPKVPYKRGAPSYEAPLDILYKRLAAAKGDVERKSIRKQIEVMIDKRSLLETAVRKLVRRVALSIDHENQLILARPRQISDLDCHHALVKAFSQNCFDFGKHTYALKYAYILTNMCEAGLDVDTVINQMRQVCKALPPIGRID